MTSATKTLSRRSPRYQLNFRWLLWTLALVIVVVPAIYGWHLWALRRSAHRLLTQATNIAATYPPTAVDPQTGRSAPLTVESATKLNEAARMLWNYVQFRPDDAKGRTLLAEVFIRAPDGANNPGRAVELLREAIAVAPPESINRLRIELAKQLGASRQFSEAAETAKICLDDLGDSPDADPQLIAEGWRELAQSVAALIGSEQPLDFLELRMPVGGVIAKAVEKNPVHPGVAFDLAVLHREPKYREYLSPEQQADLTAAGITPEQRADQIIAEMLARNPENSIAFLRSYAYKAQYDIEGAVEDLLRAHQLDPDSIEANIGLAAWYGGAAESPQPPDWKASRQHAQRLVELLPDQDSGYLLLGNAQFELDEHDAAIDTWLKGLAADGSQAIAIYERLIRGLITLKRFEQAEQHLASLLGLITRRSRRSDVEPREISLAYRTEAILQAELARGRGQFDVSIDELVGLVKSSSDPLEQTKACALLGTVLAERGQHLHAAHYLELASDLKPEDLMLARAAAAQLAAAGRDDRAESKFERVIALSDSTEDLLAYAEFFRDVLARRSPELRNWARLDQLISRIEERREAQPLPEPWRLEALRVSARLGRAIERRASGEGAEGGTPLEFPELAGLDATPEKSALMCKSLIEIHRALGNTDRVQALVDELRRVAAGTSDAYLVPAEVARAAGDVAKARQLLDEGLQAVADPTAQREIELALVNLELTEDKIDEALARMDRLLERFPDDGSLMMQAIELRVALDQIPETALPWEARLPRFEGHDGPIASYFQASRNLRKATDAATARNERSRLFVEIEQQRARVEQGLPEWPPAYALTGWIRDAQSLDQTANISPEHRNRLANEARAAFERAVQMGDRRPAVLFRLSNMVDLQSASQILSLLDRRVISAIPQLASRAADVSLALNDLAGAERVAVMAVERRPNDLDGWLMLAQVRLRQQRFAEADEAAGKAEILARQNTESAEGLIEVFLFHATALEFTRDAAENKKHLSHAKQLMETIGAAQKTEQEKMDTEARLLAAIKDPLAPAKFYQLYRSNPTDEPTLAGIANFFENNESIEHNTTEILIDVWEDLVALDPSNETYKLRLAIALNRRGTPEDFSKSMKLFAADGESSDSAPLRRRRAALLVNRRNVPTAERIENLRSATDLIDSVIKSADVQPSDHLLIAQMAEERRRLLDPQTPEQEQESQDLLERARQSYLRAADMPTVAPFELFTIAEFLIRVEDYFQAESLIARFEQTQANAVIPSAGPVALRVQLETRRNAPDKDARIQQLVNSYIQSVEALTNITPLTRANLFVRIASLYEYAGKPAEALPWYRKAAEVDDAALGNLMRAVAQQGNKREAVELCRQVYERTRKPEYIFGLSNFLIEGRPDLEAFAAAESLFNTALSDNPKNASLALAIGNCLANHPEKASSSVDAYQRGVNIEPDNFLLLNNLATVQADLPEQRDQALANINRAIEIQGNRPDLLNTKATVLMLRGELDAALEILNTIINPQSDVRIQVVYAETNWKLFQRSGDAKFEAAARHALQIAVDGGVESAVLTPFELQRLNALQTELNPPPSSEEPVVQATAEERTE